MGTPLDFIALTERLNEALARINQMEIRIADLEGSVNRTVGTVTPKVDEVLMKTNNSIMPTPNVVGVALSTAPSLSLLELAARGDSDAISCLLGDQNDSNISQQRAENGDSALHIAAREGHLGTVIVLLGKVKVDDPGYLLRTPLHCAAAHGHLKVVECLLNAGAQVDAKDGYGKAPLALASENEHTEIVVLLTQNTVRPFQASFPAFQAESLSHSDLVKYLKENGISLEVCNSKGNGLVLQAARSGRWEIVDFLLERGLSATDCQLPYECALVLAARAGQADAVRHLLRRGAASDDIQVMWGLMKARSAAVVGVFLEAAPDAVRGEAGKTGLLEAASDGQLEPLAALLDLGIDVNCKGRNNSTALLAAASYGHIACVRELLRRGADVDAKSGDGYTPLHWAALCGHEECVRALLEAGASMAEKDNDGKTPLEMAKSESIRRIFNTVP